MAGLRAVCLVAVAGHGNLGFETTSCVWYSQCLPRPRAPPPSAPALRMHIPVDSTMTGTAGVRRRRVTPSSDDSTTSAPCCDTRANAPPRTAITASAATTLDRAPTDLPSAPGLLAYAWEGSTSLRRIGEPKERPRNLRVEATPKANLFQPCTSLPQRAEGWGPGPVAAASTPSPSRQPRHRQLCTSRQVQVARVGPSPRQWQGCTRTFAWAARSVS
jgi:hypothetical protein